MISSSGSAVDIDEISFTAVLGLIRARLQDGPASPAGTLATSPVNRGIAAAG